MLLSRSHERATHEGLTIFLKNIVENMQLISNFIHLMYNKNKQKEHSF